MRAKAQCLFTDLFPSPKWNGLEKVVKTLRRPCSGILWLLASMDCSRCWAFGARKSLGILVEYQRAVNRKCCAGWRRIIERNETIELVFSNRSPRGFRELYVNIIVLGWKSSTNSDIWWKSAAYTRKLKCGLEKIPWILVAITCPICSNPKYSCPKQLFSQF